MANTELRRVYLNNGGYAPNGSYYGHGAPLYEFVYDGGEGYDIGTLRASDRVRAKEHVLAIHKDATFYR